MSSVGAHHEGEHPAATAGLRRLQIEVELNRALVGDELGAADEARHELARRGEGGDVEQLVRAAHAARVAAAAASEGGAEEDAGAAPEELPPAYRGHEPGRPSLVRSSPSCITDTAKAPSRVKMVPAAKPRAPAAVGLC